MVTELAAVLAFLAPAPQFQGAGKFLLESPSGKPVLPFALKGTEVKAEIDGFGAAVTVTQTFRNPNRMPIEAVYTFPLPEDAAVDRMRMEIGDRVIEGEIARRADARRTYDEAKRRGQIASLLDQERPNIFTQSVANLMPGAEVKVQLRYVQTLNYREGEYEFTFPMTVGPMYTDRNTPDPDKISPPRMRTGAGISLDVQIHGGARLMNVQSVLHEIDTNRASEDVTRVSLRRRDEIPNRDFILRYRLSGNTVQPATLSNFDPVKGGTFALFLVPPKAPPPAGIQPKEMIFVMDQSGSQSGFPIEKSKELTLKLLRKMGPNDKFNVLGFNNSVTPLWSQSRLNSPKNLAEAESYVSSMNADGGTELEKAIVAIGAMPPDPERLRMVVFNTDGYAGQMDLILREAKRNQDKGRMFMFGIGNSVNRSLIDALAMVGRGDKEVVTLAESADGAVDRLYRRLNSPVLTDISVQADGIRDLSPEAVPDVFLERPVVVFGRYDRPGPASITVSGRQADGTLWTRQVDVQLSDRNDQAVLPSLWARKRLEELLAIQEIPSDLVAAKGVPAGENPAEKLALEYHLMSPYTSFVAVEKRVVNVNGQSHTVRVPVEQADGVQEDRTKGLMPSHYRSLSYGGSPASASLAAKSAPVVPANLAKQQIERGSRESEAILPTIPNKFDPNLRLLKGEFAVQVTLTTWSNDVLTRLKKAGLKIDVEIKGMKVVVGRLDASKLPRIAQIPQVDRISKLAR